jgi:hypothetical protein
METIIQVGNPSLSGALMVIAIIAVFYIIIKFASINEAIKKKDKERGKIIKKGNIIFMIFAIVIIATMFNSFLFFIDYTMENIDITEEEVIAIDGDNSGKYVITKNNRYYFDKSSLDFRIMLEENYLGHVCEIEYYKLSKTVIRIKVIE